MDAQEKESTYISLKRKPPCIICRTQTYVADLSDEYLALPLCEVVILGRGPGDEVAPRQVLGHQHRVQAGLVQARQPHHERGLDQRAQDLRLSPNLKLLRVYLEIFIFHEVHFSPYSSPDGDTWLPQRRLFLSL